MGLINMIKGQFIDVIEWQDDDSRETIVHRFERPGQQIMMGAQLTVRPSQAAVFVNEGKIADVFGPGRYELTTQNMPIMTTLNSWKYGFDSPFKADVYFVNTRQFVDVKWGTLNPVMMRDTDFGMIRLRAFGVFAFRVQDPKKLILEVAGTGAELTVEDVAGQFRKGIVSVLSDAIAESKTAALDLASKYEELGRIVGDKMQKTLEEYGAGITALTIENISLPPEVEAALDKRTSMGVVGDLNKYTQFQAAEALREMANNEGGGANMAGMGAGMGAGQVFGQVMAGAMAANQAAAQQRPATVPCVACGAGIAPGSAFCSQCGAKQQATACTACGAPLNPGAAFCAKCGAKQ